MKEGSGQPRSFFGKKERDGMFLVKKRILAIILLIVVASVLSGCGEKPPQTPVSGSHGNGYPLTIADDSGRSVTLEKQPERIVSLSPSHTEILFALGLKDRIVGVTEYCDYPEEALSKTKIGGFSTPSVEKIIELRPDLVLAGDMHHQPVITLEAAHVNVLVFSPSTLGEILAVIDKIGQASGEGPAAQNLLDNLQQRVDAVTNKVKGVKGDKPLVFYEVWHEPLISAADNTLIGELIRLSGGENLIGSSKDLYPKISEEIILEKNPDVMIHSYGHGSSESLSADTILQRHGWGHLNFVQNNRITGLDANLIDRAGPRIVEALEAVARAIHPDLYTSPEKVENAS